MRPEIIFLDCAHTLLRPAEAIGAVYAGAARRFGIPCGEAAEVELRFRQAWRGAGRPHYPDGPDETADLRWWRGIVRRALGVRLGREEETGTDKDGTGTDMGCELREAGDFEACFQSLFQHYAEPSAWILYPDVLPTLRALQGKIRLGLLSNFDARLHGLLEGHGLRGFFELVVLSSESAACKPDPAIFRRAEAMAALAPERCLLAGDDPENDWQGAAAAGWQVFRLERPRNSLEGLLSILPAPDRNA